MKLIIEIDDDYFEILKYEARNGNDFLPIKIIANGIPLEDIKEQYDKGYKDGVKETFIEELEKIKAEIEEIKGLRDNPYSNETEYSVSMEELRELFDKHISELKGENK